MKHRKKKSPPALTNDSHSSPSLPQQRTLPFWLGAACVLVAAGASLMLVLQHFVGMKLPGCGIGSGCDQAARSVWGSVPLIGIPTSSMGLAFFAALAVGWLGSGGVVTSSYKWIVRLGVLISAGFLVVIAVEKHICIYCLAAHAGNLAFLFVVENAAIRRAEPRGWRASPATVALAFVGSLALLGGLEWQHKQTIATKAEGDLADSTQRIIAQTNTALNETEAVHTPPGGFTGRYRQGPEDAPIRLVIFSDYQCKDCRDIDMQVRSILARRSDVSVSAKHFPLAADCNVHMGGRTMHGNACWAARAAEAAGILRGNDGFWQMHEWLFDRGGSFTDAELPIGLRQLGYEDPQQFINVMMSNRTLDLVKADVNEGYSLGLFFTPMVFINGVELRGFVNSPTALSRAIEAVAATNPPPGTAMQDTPPLAPGKAVGDWREARAFSLPPKSNDWSLGPADAKIKIWVWGDYQNTITRELDEKIRASMKQGRNIQYTYRHYPLDQSCNPNIPRTSSADGCWGARAAEAAGSLGGNQAYWKMHEWLLSNQTRFNNDALRQAAPQLGLDPDALLAAMSSAQVGSAVMQDISLGRPMITQGVPTLYVNGKWVARWRMDNANVLDLIFDEAGK